MNFERAYPRPTQRKRHMLLLRRLAKWIVATMIIASPIVNLILRGKAWSIIVILGAWTVWKFIFAPDMVEYNMINQTVKGLLHVTFILAAIDIFLVPGWANFVIPLVFFAAFITALIFFFIDINRQKQSTMPMVWLTLLSIILVSSALLGWLEMNWPMIMLGALTGLLSIVGLVTLWKDLFMEIRKRFHIK